MAWVFGKKRKWTSTWFVSCCSVWSLGCLHLLAAHCSVLLLLLFFVDFFLFGVCVLTCISFSFVHFTCWLMENVGGSCSIVFKSASSYCSAGQLLKWKERTSQWSCKLTLWGKCDQTTDVLSCHVKQAILVADLVWSRFLFRAAKLFKNPEVSGSSA